MARTMLEFYEEGYEEARALHEKHLLLMSGGYPLTDRHGRSLPYAMVGSWQAKAWRRGFDAYRDSVRARTPDGE